MSEHSIPEYIDRYKVVSILGKGGMGTVYKCFDPELQRFVAIKVLSCKSGRVFSDMIRMRFLREAFATAQLQHPGIPPIYEVKTSSEGNVYYVMKVIEGKSLRQILYEIKNDISGESSYDLFRMIEIFRDVCQAVDYAHNKGYIHRDLKPSNIFVGDYGEVYVIDWGLTKVITEVWQKQQEETEKIILRKWDSGLGDTSSGGSQNAGFLSETIPDSELCNDFVPGSFPDDFDISKHEKDFGDESEEIKLTRTLTRTLLLDEVISENDKKYLANVNKFISPVLPKDDNPTLTKHGKVLGTLSYMPPEQALGNIEILGVTSDIYALGVILYEILTLDLPVNSTNFKEAVNKKLAMEFDPPEICVVDKDIPHELSEIAMKSLQPDPQKRFQSLTEMTKALTFWLEGKSQFRTEIEGDMGEDENEIEIFQTSKEQKWEIKKDSVTTVTCSDVNLNSYAVFKKDFLGDVRFKADVVAYPENEESDDINEFAFVVKGSVPTPWRGFIDGYTVHFAANKNTRVFISKNDVEVVSNEYVMVEPRRRYSVTIECIGESIRVMLNQHVILFYKDTDFFDGQKFGFFHKGGNIVYSNICIQTRGLPNKINSIDVPEALLAEGCYQSALKRFLSIAQGHKDRYEGAWARYRAGVAMWYAEHNIKKTLEVWAPLKDSPYATFEKLGRVFLELEAGRPLKAAKIIESIVVTDKPVPNLSPIADMVFTQAQHWLREKAETEKDWKIIDAWVRLTLILGQRLENKESMTPSIMWRWILLALTQYPHHLSECIQFLRDTFGKGRGMFAEILTTIEPLMTILRRSAKMSDNAFLVDKVMRLILNHHTTLGNLETLVRFYIQSGHIDIARRISLHIYSLCKKYKTEIPPGPIAFLACTAWASGDNSATELIETMVENSSEWGKADGLLLMGLDYYRKGDIKKARECWMEVVRNRIAMVYNRHLVGKGLLGELPPDPVEAGVPNRSDHRLLYCLFLGFKYFVDWQHSKEEKSRQEAVRLLTKALSLMRPSYDIYSATDFFVKAPLEQMNCKPPDKPEPEPLSEEEEIWLYKLTVAASHESPYELTKVKKTTRRRNGRT